MPVTGLDDTGAVGARDGAGALRSGEVALRRGDRLRIVGGHDGFEGDAVFAGSGQRVCGRGGECG